LDTTQEIQYSKKRVHRIAVSSFFFLAGLSFSTWASRIPDIQQKLHLSNADLGGILLGLPLGLMTSLPLAGYLVAKFGSRHIVLISALAYASILPFPGLMDSSLALMGCLFLFGMAGNMLNISMNTQAISTEVEYGRTIMASYHGIWSLAGFTGAAAGNLFTSLHFTPFHHFLCISVSGIILILVAQRYLIAKDYHYDENQPIFAKPDRSLINFGFIAFCCMICEGAMFDWSGVYFRKVIQPGEGLVTAGFTAFMCTMATGRFVGDWLALKLGKRATLQLSGIFTATGLLVAVIFPYFIPAVIGFLLVGAGVSSVVPLVYSAAGKSEVLSPGVAIAAVSTIGYLGFLFGPPFIGFIAQASSLQVALGLIAVLGASITVISSFTKLK
jgi:MFS family permease